jgi:hypothetical protein
MLKKVLGFRDFALPSGFRSSITVNIGVKLVMTFVFSMGYVNLFKVINSEAEALKLPRVLPVDRT